jgi:hypothetical protein
LPMVGLPLALVLLGAGAIERDARWAYLVRGVSALLVAGNLYYLFVDFYLPFQRHELGVVAQRIGKRSPPVGSWHFLPKDELVRALSRLDPAPRQIISPGSIHRVLRALMDGMSSAVVTAEEANHKLPSVYVDYRSAMRDKPRHCVRAKKGKLCFGAPTVVDQHFVIYRSR